MLGFGLRSELNCASFESRGVELNNWIFSVSCTFEKWRLDMKVKLVNCTAWVLWT